ncbi:hypothetical protein M441DRAFT_54195, partial [Trichoderma asperellum CBS 433.97]
MERPTAPFPLQLAPLIPFQSVVPSVLSSCSYLYGQPVNERPENMAPSLARPTGFPLQHIAIGIN